MADTGVQGIRTLESFPSTHVEEFWRRGINFLWPNGKTPLTCLTSRMKSVKVTSQIFHWFQKDYQTRRGACALYSNAAMSVNYGTTWGTGIPADTVFYTKVSAELASHFIPNQVVEVRRIGNSSNAADPNVVITAVVLGKIVNGANSCLTLRSLEADDGSADFSGSTYLQASTETDVCDISVIGTAFADATGIPQAISYDATDFSNYIQLFKWYFKLGELAQLEDYRTGDQYLEKKKDALLYHSLDIERSLWHGIKKVGSDGEGNTVRYTQGLFRFVREWSAGNSGANWGNFQTASDVVSGGSWATYGWGWLSDRIKEAARYGSNDFWCICGDGVLTAVQALAEAKGTIYLQPGEKEFGMRIMRLITPFGEFTMLTNPEWSLDPVKQNCMALLEPANMQYNYMIDTSFRPDINFKKGGKDAIGARIEGYETACGLSVIHPQTMGIFFGIGLDHVA